MDKFLLWLVHLYLHYNYKKYRQPILYIKGTGKDYPRYLLYTEDPAVYRRMDDF
jgi:hypothetical protein